MKTKLTLAIATVLVAVTVFMTARIYHVNRNGYSASTSPPAYFPIRLKTYKVLPSDTDDHPYDTHDCPTIYHGMSDKEIKSACGRATVRAAIGCERCWPVLDADGYLTYDHNDFLISTAPDHQHVLYVPVGKENTGKLLVFLAGAPGNPDQDLPHEPYYWLYKVMARQGYHVLGLSTYTGGVTAGAHFEEYMLEIITGDDVSNEETMSDHPQDSLHHRLVKVLEWAAREHPGDGWGRYLIDGEVNWAQINLAGFSGGSTYASYMGMLHQEVGRVALFSGPNDGKMDDGVWVPAPYIKHIERVTDTRYYGLVHWYNKANTKNCGVETVLYKVEEAWRKFGMDVNPERWFDPQPGVAPDFLGSHMLISYDAGTNANQAHGSVVFDEYMDCDCVSENECTEKERIGYEAAWRYILGTGDASVSTQ